MTKGSSLVGGSFFTEQRLKRLIVPGDQIHIISSGRKMFIMSRFAETQCPPLQLRVELPAPPASRRFLRFFPLRRVIPNVSIGATMTRQAGATDARIFDWDQEDLALTYAAPITSFATRRSRAAKSCGLVKIVTSLALRAPAPPSPTAFNAHQALS